MKTLRAVLRFYAEAESDRYAEYGKDIPNNFDFYLVGGHILKNMRLVDSLNSIDGETIEVCEATGREFDPEGREIWVVKLSNIAAYRMRYPASALFPSPVQPGTTDAQS